MKPRNQNKILAKSDKTTVVMFVIQLSLLFENQSCLCLKKVDSKFPNFPNFPKFPNFPSFPLIPLTPLFPLNNVDRIT